MCSLGDERITRRIRPGTRDLACEFVRHDATIGARTLPPLPRENVVNMSTHSMRRSSSEPRHDHAPDTDDVWAWIVIGLFAGAVTLAVWVPLIASLRLS